MPAYALLVALCIVGACLAYLAPLNHDTGLFLNIAEHVWNGERQYVEIEHNNAPYIVYYSLLTVALEKISGMRTMTAFCLVQFVVLTCAAMMAMRVVALHPRYREQFVLYAWAVAIAFICFFVPLVNQWSHYDFGQRDHLFIALFLPYALMNLNALDGVSLPRRMRITNSVVAGLACIIKPHFLLFLCGSELYMLWRRKGQPVLRMEALIPGLMFGAAYVWFLIGYPVLAHAERMREIYSAYQYASWPEFIATSAGSYFDLIFFVVLIFALLLSSPVKVPGAGYLATMLAMGVLSYALHKSGFNYQLIPFHAFFLLLFWQVLLHREMLPRALIYVACAALLLPLATALGTVEKIVASAPEVMEKRDALRARFDGKGAALLSTSVAPGFPIIIDAGMHDVLTEIMLIFLPAYYAAQGNTGQVHYHLPAQMSKNELYFFRRTVQDVLEKKPAILLVDERDEKQALPGMRFDILAYFSQDAGFREALLHYRRLDLTIDDLAFYERQ